MFLSPVKSLLFSLVCVMSLWAYFPGPVAAFSLQPAILELAADPGQEVAGSIDIANDEGRARDFQITVQRFLAVGQEGRQEFLPPEEQEGLPSWIQIPRRVHLASGEVKHVDFGIRIPREAAPGGYYVAIFFSAINQEEDGGSEKIVMGARTGSLLLFTVRGNVHADIQVRSFQGQQPSPYWWPTSFDVFLENKGSTHASPRGMIVLRNIFGQISHFIPINTEGARVLPQSSRHFSMHWPEVKRDGGFWYNVAQEIRWFGIGLYQAEIVWLDESASSTHDRVKMVIIPWHLLLFFIVGALVLGIGLARRRLYRTSFS